MKVLMFGWEYPPHVFGGLATANYGISQGLHAQGDMDITLSLPKPFGDEDRSARQIVAMNAVPIAYRDVSADYVRERVGNIMDPDLYFRLREHLYADFNYMHVNDLGAMEFAGGYPGNLHEEINNYSIIAGVVARTLDYDIIHAHDWLTYPAGIHAKQVSGKPLEVSAVTVASVVLVLSVASAVSVTMSTRLPQRTTSLRTSVMNSTRWTSNQ